MNLGDYAVSVAGLTIIVHSLPLLGRHHLLKFQPFLAHTIRSSINIYIFLPARLGRDTLCFAYTAKLDFH